MDSTYTHNMDKVIPGQETIFPPGPNRGDTWDSNKPFMKD